MANTTKLLQQANFICSAPALKDCPEGIEAEVAFAGRSNAGKSSAINCLCDQRKLARISKTPGRTQQMNFFALNEKQCLVDLPGYGYAKVPEAMKRKWQANLQEYFESRNSLKGVILLMDVRHPLKPFDLLMINWSKQYQMPLHILLTKSDKFKRGANQKSLQLVRNAIKPDNTEELNFISAQLFSSLNSDGVKEAESVILDWLHQGLESEENLEQPELN